MNTQKQSLLINYLQQANLMVVNYEFSEFRPPNYTRSYKVEPFESIPPRLSIAHDDLSTVKALYELVAKHPFDFDPGSLIGSRELGLWFVRTEEEVERGFSESVKHILSPNALYKANPRFVADLETYPLGAFTPEGIKVNKIGGADLAIYGVGKPSTEFKPLVYVVIPLSPFANKDFHSCLRLLQEDVSFWPDKVVLGQITWEKNPRNLYSNMDSVNRDMLIHSFCAKGITLADDPIFAIKEAIELSGLKINNPAPASLPS